ncbi:Armadillo repeat-containing protein [Schistosoma japonicum]|uniref:Armadillo repeat-containing protein n=1 Tax=Schistosoma japonicum TaxID=6182 RepID=C1L474_SCHJA|nr:Armadillo repeat-containing protein [Schistosoma japonicum]CAX69502.1 novel protin putative armadillo repeat containing 1 [Schistosoma japonicum]
MCGLQALKDIKKLAEDDSRYTALMKDKTTLQGLVLLLSNKNKSIVSLVLQILIIIRRRPGGDDVLRSLLGLSEQLNDLKKSTNSIDNEDDRLISNSAEELLSLFNCSTKQNSPKPIKANPEKPHSISRPKSVILQLRGLTSEDDIEIICSKLLKIRGVVSITFQLHRHRVLVCTIPSLDPDCLIQAISSVNNNSDQSDGIHRTNSNHPTITAQIVKKKHRVQSLCRHSSFNGFKYRQSLKNTEVPPYLEDDADLFEVDETRAAPKLRDAPSKQDSSKGPIGWLSDFLEKSLFW